MRSLPTRRLRALSLAVATALLTLALAACTESEDEAPAVGAASAALDAEQGVPGVSGSRIVFGQSAAFTGPAEGLGLAETQSVQRDIAGALEPAFLIGVGLAVSYEDDAHVQI